MKFSYINLGTPILQAIFFRTTINPGAGAGGGIFQEHYCWRRKISNHYCLLHVRLLFNCQYCAACEKSYKMKICLCATIYQLSEYHYCTDNLQVRHNTYNLTGFRDGYDQICWCYDIRVSVGINMNLSWNRHTVCVIFMIIYIHYLADSFDQLTDIRHMFFTSSDIFYFYVEISLLWHIFAAECNFV